MKTIQEHKADATLNIKESYEEGVMTRREWITLMHSKGHSVKIVQSPLVQYNRIKYNRMNAAEQEEYEKRCNAKKDEYRLYITQTCSYTITKAEFDYFNTL